MRGGYCHDLGWSPVYFLLFLFVCVCVSLGVALHLLCFIRLTCFSSTHLISSIYIYKPQFFIQIVTAFREVTSGTTRIFFPCKCSQLFSIVPFSVLIVFVSSCSRATAHASSCLLQAHFLLLLILHGSPALHSALIQWT